MPTASAAHRKCMELWRDALVARAGPRRGKLNSTSATDNPLVFVAGGWRLQVLDDRSSRAAENFSRAAIGDGGGTSLPLPLPRWGGIFRSVGTEHMTNPHPPGLLPGIPHQGAGGSTPDFMLAHCHRCSSHEVKIRRLARSAFPSTRFQTFRRAREDYVSMGDVRPRARLRADARQSPTDYCP